MPIPRYIFCRCLTPWLTFSYRPGAILKLSDDVLLKIFRYYLDASPRFWPRLVHTCRKWRHFVFTFQQALHLRLFFSSGTPVLKTLVCWPALPIVLEYGGSLALDPPSPKDEDNVTAALKQFNRICSISLTITTSLLDKLDKPFLSLEELVLLSRYRMPLTLPSAFQWGPRLRRLHLTRIDFPALLRLLYSSRNLVELCLQDALNSWYFSIEELTDALSGMAQLRSLSLHFLSTIDFVSPPTPLGRHVVLPALTHLGFRGPIKCLERLILRIYAPRLGHIQVTVTDRFGSGYDLSRLGKFINRIEMFKSHNRARILSSEGAISISFTQPRAPTCFKFRLFSELLSGQLFAITHILPHFSAFLLDVEELHISATQTASNSSLEDSLYSERWMGLLHLFTGVKWLHLDVNDPTNIVRTVQSMSWQHKTTVLPAPYKLYLPHPGPCHAPLSETVVSFMTSRWRSGYPVGVEYERLCRVSELHGRGAPLHTVPLHYYY